MRCGNAHEASPSTTCCAWCMISWECTIVCCSLPHVLMVLLMLCGTCAVLLRQRLVRIILVSGSAGLPDLLSLDFGVLLIEDVNLHLSSDKCCMHGLVSLSVPDCTCCLYFCVAAQHASDPSCHFDDVILMAGKQRCCDKSLSCTSQHVSLTAVVLSTVVCFSASSWSLIATHPFCNSLSVHSAKSESLMGWFSRVEYEARQQYSAIVHCMVVTPLEATALCCPMQCSLCFHLTVQQKAQPRS